MNYVPVPRPMLELGKTLPVDVWDASGTLLLGKGQPISSQQQIEMLSAHQAGMTQSDAQAWQRSYDRQIHAMRKDGADVEIVARAHLPREIAEADYGLGNEVRAGWLALQETLRGLLYQGESAISPLPRLEAIELQALELLKNDPDECLFILFQALDEVVLGYCATHALLTAVVCELSAEKLGMADSARRVLFRSALVMNIGMAQTQDKLAWQSSAPVEAQRKLIREHPQTSLEILQGLGVTDPDQLDIVRWHHEFDESWGMPRNLESRRILRMADSFVAKMAPRKTRLAMSPLGAVKSIYFGTTVDTTMLGSAMATAVGFYPPGTFVQLVNGEKAVAVARGLRANYPLVVSIVNAGGMPLANYVCRETTDPHFAIRSPINAEKVRVKVNLEKALQARAEHGA